MTVILELPPEIESRALEQAAAQGLPVEKFLASVIAKNLNGGEGKPFYETASTDDWEREFREWANSHAYITAPPADDSRESIYREREDSQL